MEDMQKLRERAQRVQLALFDVDGVMTDGQLYYSDQGIEIKAFHSQDGLGLKMLIRSGVEVGVITGRDTPAVSQRMASLGIDRVVAGCSDKLTAAQAMLEQLDLAPDAVCFTGDDLIDVAVMQWAGLAISVPNGHKSAQAAAHWITPRSGGHGAVRDVCDLLMEARQ